MSMDPTPLMQKVAEFVDDLERDYGQDAELADAVVLVELRYREDGEDLNAVEGRVVSGRNTVGVGIVARGLYALVAPEAAA
jgi:hypothetical protein